MSWTEVMKVLCTPEVVSLLLVLITAILVKLKYVTEADIATAKRMLKGGDKTISEITDAVKLTAPAVEAIKVEMESPDTNKKKINRAARKLFKGWLGGM